MTEVLHAANPVIGPWVLKPTFPRTPIEEWTCTFLPVFLVYRPVPLQPVLRIPSSSRTRYWSNYRTRTAAASSTADSAGVPEDNGKAAVERAGTEAL